MGIFAKTEIKKGEMLAIFGGYIMGAKEEEKLPSRINDCGLQISEDFVLGGRDESEIYKTDYFNHSCNPNAGFKGQIFLIAMRKIKKNDEVVFDYAMALHRSKGVKMYKMRCLCGSEKCRKVVTDYDWKKPELQKKYKGYFQWYLQEKINKKSKL